MSSQDLPSPGIEPGSLALQADSESPDIFSYFSQLFLKCLKLRGFPLCILKASSFLSHRKVLNVKVEPFSLRGPALMSPSLGVLNQSTGALGKGGWF